ncbi:Protein of unknown function [Pyronema omphalodes CBS 100304]|uniref:Uncharacterized protein n=1 Tax=Pyronema omphalodes (strain CBS 100304) TaxID=1076935 RepID=U4L7G2_PYROM|nr:Protein of unknown function [Pyronema omphalodes CBS 100304]
MAKELNEEAHDSDGDDNTGSQPNARQIVSLKEQQKKTVKTIKKQCEMWARQGISLLVYGAPSEEKVPDFTYYSSPQVVQYGHLLVENDFTATRLGQFLRGTVTAIAAKQAAKGAENPNRKKGALRQSLPVTIIALINKFHKTNTKDLSKMPRQVDTFLMAMGIRKIRWVSPPDWEEKEQDDIIKVLISGKYADMERVEKCLKEGTLRIYKPCRAT